MRVERVIYGLLIIAAAAFAAINWRKAALFQADNDTLRTRVETLESEVTQSTQSADLLKTSAEKLRAQTSELAKLRGEVTQLRTVATNANALSAENQRLRQQLQARGSAVPPAHPSPLEAYAGRDQFPRNSWNFAGYNSPEAALVSAIWAMREGDPKTYLNSLAPNEQQRVAQDWQSQNKSEAEVAEKHKNDVAAISGLRVLTRESSAPNEMVMSVYLEGPGRVEKVRMNQVGQDWKFGGFIQDQQPQPSAQPVPQK